MTVTLPDSMCRAVRWRPVLVVEAAGKHAGSTGGRCLRRRPAVLLDPKNVCSKRVAHPRLCWVTPPSAHGRSYGTGPSYGTRPCAKTGRLMERMLVSGNAGLSARGRSHGMGPLHGTGPLHGAGPSHGTGPCDYDQFGILGKRDFWLASRWPWRTGNQAAGYRTTAPLRSWLLPMPRCADISRSAAP